MKSLATLAFTLHCVCMCYYPLTLLPISLIHWAKKLWYESSMYFAVQKQFNNGNRLLLSNLKVVAEAAAALTILKHGQFVMPNQKFTLLICWVNEKALEMIITILDEWAGKKANALTRICSNSLDALHTLFSFFHFMLIHFHFYPCTLEKKRYAF